MSSQSHLKSLIRPTLSLFLVLTTLTGLVYPLAVTGIAQTLFAEQALGSLLHREGGQVLGSRLIGQAFSESRYFWPRPSATMPSPYNAANSAGSNQGPLNPALTDAVNLRVEALRAADTHNTQPVPVDLVTASGSGLDPHISVAAAHFQSARVARARGLQHQVILAMIDQHTELPWLGFLGEPRVNVLSLNLSLDRLKPV